MNAIMQYKRERSKAIRQQQVTETSSDPKSASGDCFRIFQQEYRRKADRDAVQDKDEGTSERQCRTMRKASKRLHD
jgi:hypothetical protein